MRFRKKQRLILLATALLLLGGAAALVLTALDDTIAFFVSPTDIAENKVEPGRNFRIGGLVVDGSIVQRDDGVVQFGITDTANITTVTYLGILPDLFREGQGIVAQGTLDPNGTFVAEEVLAKHDENYMPKEVAEAIKDAGQWQGEDPSTPKD